MNDFPFIAIGNDELGDPLKEGDSIQCHHCYKTHPIKCGRDSKTKEKTNLILFYSCGEKSYLAGIDGKSILIKDPQRSKTNEGD